MTILALDAGNSRIKWGLWADRGFIAQGAVPTEQAGDLADAWHMLARPGLAIGSCVAGAAVRAAIDAVLAPWNIVPEWIVSRRSQCGVRSRYADPAQLGTDRWAALVGARAKFAEPCVVVDAGTAVTVDALSASGEFLGGLILPGLELMAASLARGTARLGREAGRVEAFPTSTADAIASGAVQAVCGAIDRTRAALQAAGEAVPHVVLSGGAAPLLAAHLAPPVSLVPTLVLDGLIAMARERSAAGA
jgi:type III pantothenate kinase